MNSKMKMALADDILTGIVCSQVWDRRQRNDPEIVKNADQLERVMCTVSEYLPEEMLAALEDAITNCIGAHEQAADPGHQVDDQEPPGGAKRRGI